MTIIENKDINEEKYKTKLEQHLKYSDLFDATKSRKHKTAQN